MSDARKEATKRYQQKKMQHIQFNIQTDLYADVIAYWKNHDNARRKFIEMTRELIEKERQ